MCVAFSPDRLAGIVGVVGRKGWQRGDERRVDKKTVRLQLVAEGTRMDSSKWFERNQIGDAIES